jgi:hypothetical protein
MGPRAVILSPGGNFCLTKLVFAGSDRIDLSGRYSAGYDRNFFLAQYLTTSYTSPTLERLFLPLMIK